MSGPDRDLPPLIHSLLEPRVYGAGVDRVELIETHVSWVFLTGAHAYKLKKPLDLGFLDFSTLSKRRNACREELRLNRRTAPSIYLDVVAICGAPETPELVPLARVTAGTPVLDYMVKMREFAQAAQLDRRLAAGALGLEEMDAIAVGLAGFHASIPAAGADSPWGEPESVYQFAAENFAHAAPPGLGADERRRLEALERWTDAEFEALTPVLERRKRDGFVRECHGDLHLTNLAALEDGITAFDCIEFNPALRWIDLISEAAFLMMDLMSRERDDLAWRFANAYLERTGDWDALKLLRFYLVYRSMVRAKVAAIRLRQATARGEAHDEALAKYRRHLNLADRIARPAPPLVVVMSGLSGSGKTWLSERLAAALPAFRFRSDVERKRLFGLAADADSGSALDAGIYSASAGERTYARLAELAAIGARAGFSVIADGAFLLHSQRAALIAVAAELELSAVIVRCGAGQAVLEERIRARHDAGTDASEADLAVLRRQQARAEPLDERERGVALEVDTASRVDVPSLAARLREIQAERDAAG